MGLMLLGFALLTPDGMSAMWVYLVGHSLAKGALFLATGILLHRFETVNELELRGERRLSRAVAVIFFAGGLALAGLPPFATFYGSAGLENAASRAGYGWIWFVTSAAAILTGGAVLRSGGRMFFGFGGHAISKHHAKDPVERPGPISRVMTVPALVLFIGLVIAMPQSFRREIAIIRYGWKIPDSTLDAYSTARWSRLIMRKPR
jgi:multicomponent Na+:H+ antiporter subunit D